jgi:hypothetical protein
MIDYSSQQIRDDIAPVFQPPDIDYTGRMREAKSIEAAGMEINVKEVRYSEIQQKLEDAGSRGAADYIGSGFAVRYLPGYMWQPGSDPVPKESLPIPEGVLCMLVKSGDLPPISDKEGTANNTNIIWLYKESGRSFASTTLLGEAIERGEQDESKRPQLAIQNGGYDG